jgi:hypothetical protein
MRGGLTSLLIWAMLLAAGDAVAVAQSSPAENAEGCDRNAFAAVVEQAGAQLRELTQRNKPNFQDKLRLLKDKRGWTPEQFMTEAAVYVHDEKIAELDQRSSSLLARLTSVGSSGAASGRPDCKLLDGLRDTMKGLVDTQVEKWGHMFAKLERALVE